jgi:hypothetical protein
LSGLTVAVTLDGTSNEPIDSQTYVSKTASGQAADWRLRSSRFNVREPDGTVHEVSFTENPAFEPEPTRIAGVWHPDSDEIRVYRDGNRSATTSIPSGFDTLKQDSGPLYLGSNGTAPGSGTIDDGETRLDNIIILETAWSDAQAADDFAAQPWSGIW